MTKDRFVRPGTIKSLQWGYDGDQFDPARRVSVWPYEMLGDALRTSMEAQGLLLMVFCRYWSKERPVPLAVAQGVFRISARKLNRLLDELKADGLVRLTVDGIVPDGAFGPAPHGQTQVVRLTTREMPSDWVALREGVFERDGYACVYCGSGRDLHCDHVHPVAKGGDHHPSNLVTACAACNLSKGSKTVAEWRPDIAEAMTSLRGGQ